MTPFQWDNEFLENSGGNSNCGLQTPAYKIYSDTGCSSELSDANYVLDSASKSVTFDASLFTTPSSSTPFYVGPQYPETYSPVVCSGAVVFNKTCGNEAVSLVQTEYYYFIDKT